MHNRNTILLVNSGGDIATYDSLGNQTAYLDSELDIPRTIDEMVHLEYRNGLSYFDSNTLQYGQNPSHIVNIRDKPGPGEIRNEFPLDFRNWLTHTDLTTGTIETSDFLIPSGYEVFQGDMTSTFLFGAFNSNRDRYLLGWPYSNEVYELKGLKLRNKVIPNPM